VYASARRAVAGPPFVEVWFDCDSTLTTLEGVDELGRDLPEVADLTRRAMAGEIPLEQVYARRLALIAPTRDAVARLGRRYVETLVPDAIELFAALREVGVRPRIVSGGLRPPVEALAAALGAPASDVDAVDVVFAPDGAYVDFDRTSPLARAGGKTATIAARRARHGAVALVGDGATDLEAAPAVDLFVGFGGVAAREAVRRASPVYVSAPRLAPLLAVLCDDAQLRRLRGDPRFSALVPAAEALASSVERNPR